MGTPEFSVPCLNALVDAGHDVSLVVTQPDRPKGRGRQLDPTPVKAAALARGLRVFQPEKPNWPENVAEIAAARPDVLIVVAYGAILKEALLTLAPRGAINVHASLLPRWRGMSPIQRAVWSGDRETGVTTMYMDAGVDTGDMILKSATHIGPDETAGELHDRLAVMGAHLLVETLARVADGTAPRTPQAGEATHAPRIDKPDGIVDWRCPAPAVHNHVRAVTPWPGAQAVLRGEPLLILRTGRVPAVGGAEARGQSGGPEAPAVVDATPGTIVGVAGDALRVLCGHGPIDLFQVRPAGRGTMTGAEFARGRRLQPGDRFDLPPAREVS